MYFHLLPLRIAWGFSHLPGSLMVAVALACAGCEKGGERTSGDTIRIGELTSLTGEGRPFGTASHQGALLAIEAANASGGVLGKPVTLITEDNGSKLGEAARGARKLIMGDGVMGLIGDITSARTLEAAHIAQAQNIPMVSPASSAPIVTKAGDYIFRVCFIDPFQGTVMAKFTLDSLQKTRAAVLTDLRQKYSIELAESYKEYLAANGGMVVAEQAYRSGDEEFEAALLEIQAAEPQVIFVPGHHDEAGLIVRQARELGIEVPILGGDGWDSPNLIKVGGAALEDTFFCTHFSAEHQDPRTQEFVRIYRERYKKQPATSTAALGFDAARLLLDAITRAGSIEPARVRDALAATQQFDGATGRITIGPDRNPIKPAFVLRFEKGKFSYLESIMP